MAQTVYQKNLIIESHPEALQLLKAWVDKKYPNSRLMKVTDRDRQLKGIDYIVETADDNYINIDIKVRDAASFPQRYWKNDPANQDIAVEFKQGDSPYGWANDPKSETDIVVYIFLGLEDTNFYRVVPVPHHVCRAFTSGSALPNLQNRYRTIQAHNGFTTTYCLTMPIVNIKAEYDQVLQDLGLE